MDTTILIPFAAFGLIATVAWLLMDFFTKRTSNAEQRLEDLKDPSRKKRKEAKSDAMARVLEKATPALARPLKPKDELAAGKLRSRLASAGFRSEAAPNVFLGIKFIMLLVGVFLGSGSMILLVGMNQSSLFKVIAIAGTMFYLPDLAIAFIAKRRKEQIFLGLPDAIDLMVVCVEAGLGLDQAMRKVADEMKKSYPVIAEEFSICNMQLQMGKARADVLQALGARSQVADLKSLASILVQADKFGSSIAQALRVQSEAMRTRRQQIAEEKAAKTAVKLIFPLVMFIFPGIFVVLVGPAAITMVREMFPAMQGR